jgi:hypothetical protein
MKPLTTTILHGSEEGAGQVKNQRQDNQPKQLTMPKQPAKIRDPEKIRRTHLCFYSYSIKNNKILYDCRKSKLNLFSHMLASHQDSCIHGLGMSPAT